MRRCQVLGRQRDASRIVSIDSSAAERTPGVKTVVTGSDFAETPAALGLGEAAIDLGDISESMIARTKVLYHGHTVAAVAATTFDIAKEAAEKIKVVYEPLEPVTDIDRAIAPDAPILHPTLKTKGAPEGATGPTNVASRLELKRGDVDAGFAEADVIVEREFR